MSIRSNDSHTRATAAAASAVFLSVQIILTLRISGLIRVSLHGKLSSALSPATNVFRASVVVTSPQPAVEAIARDARTMTASFLYMRCKVDA